MNVGAVSTLTGLLEVWDAHVTGPDDSYYGDAGIDALAVRDSSVYLGGHFAWLEGIRRGGLARIGFPSGIVSGWNPDPGPWEGDFNRDVTALFMGEHDLYLSGWFESIGDSSRGFLAAVDAETGILSPWNPGANSGSKAITGAGDTLLVGGEFQGVGAEWRERRDGLAAFDLTTGKLKPWNPRMSGLGVNTLIAGAGQVYVGGYFDGLGGRSRYCLGAVDTVAGDATDWDPACTGPVLALRAVGDTLYVGGGFATLGGRPRSCVGAFETVRGTLLDWAPVASDAVWVIEPAGRRVFLGGDFYDFNGVRRPGLVAVDAASGELDSFDCKLTFAGIRALVASADTLYAGGVFLDIGGKRQQNLAALDANTGAAFDWRADPTGLVTGIVKIDTMLFVSGTFGFIAGQPRTGLAALSSATGAVLDWNPGLNSTVWGLSTYDRTLYAGGSFTEALGCVQAHVAGLRLDALPPEPPPVPTRVAFSPVWPNPAADQISMELTVPSADRVSLALYDIQGRLISPVMYQQPLVSGRHRLTIPIAGLAKGFYLCRVSVGDRTATRKFLVIQ